AGADSRARGRCADGRARSHRGTDERRERQRCRLLLPHARESRRAPEGSRMHLAVELRNASFAYGHGSPVLRDVDLRIQQGEFVAIAGPNGGGKTTLIRLILGLERPASGEALLFGEPAGSFSRRHTLGYLAQRNRLGTEGPATGRAGSSPAG